MKSEEILEALTDIDDELIILSDIDELHEQSGIIDNNDFDEEWSNIEVYKTHRQKSIIVIAAIIIGALISLFVYKIIMYREARVADKEKNNETIEENVEGKINGIEYGGKFGKEEKMVYGIKNYEELKGYIDSGKIKSIDNKSIVNKYTDEDSNLHNINGETVDSIIFFSEDNEFYNLEINGRIYNELKSLFNFKGEYYYLIKTYKYIYDNTNLEINDKETVYSIAIKNQDDKYVVFEYDNGVLNYATTINCDLDKCEFYDYGFMVNESKECYLFDNLPEKINDINGEKANITPIHISIEGNIDIYNNFGETAYKASVAEDKIICYVTSFAGNGWVKVQSNLDLSAYSNNFESVWININNYTVELLDY